MGLTPKAKKISKIVGIAIAVLILGIAWTQGWLDTTKVTKSEAVGQIDLGSVGTDNNGNVIKVAEIPHPTKKAASMKVPTWNFGQMQWESQFSWLYSVGGLITTEGSLFEKAGIKVRLVRQDDCMAGIAEIVKCATAYKSDPNTTEGLHGYNVMFDGSAGFLKNLESQFAPLGAAYKPVIIPYFAGKSYGADALWVPRTWMEEGADGKLTIIKDSLKGCVISTVPKDGDDNLISNLSSITQIPKNFNIGTYDPEAINVSAVSAFTMAADQAIAGNGQGVEVEFKLKKGAGVAGTIKKRVRAFSSWSPEDQQAAEEVGGFYRVLSTKEYDSQMPCATITFKKFLDDNRDKVVDMLICLSQASDQITSNRSALKRAAEAAVEVYGNKDVSYFLNMYNGQTMRDAQGEMVEVGGNKVMNLADNAEYFGLDGGMNVAQRVYNTYGNILVKQYPDDVPGGIIPFNKVYDISILQDAVDKAKQSGGAFITKAAVADFSKDAEMKAVVGQANYQINFATGQATFLPGTEETLQRILDQALIGSNTLLQINGHTDNTGNPDANQALSERRAQAVASWLKQQAPGRFSGFRIKVKGLGQTAPVASNGSENGRAQNRRVEVLIGTTN